MNRLFGCEIAKCCVFCSMFPRSTHETFAQKLYQTFKNHNRFTKPKLSRSDFTICHYAGDVSMLCLYPFFFLSDVYIIKFRPKKQDVIVFV